MKSHRVATRALCCLLVCAWPSTGLAISGLEALGDLQRYKARMGERSSPDQCRSYYRSFEVRTRMSAGARRKGLEACLAARKSRKELRLVDQSRRPKQREPAIQVPSVPAPR